MGRSSYWGDDQRQDGEAGGAAGGDMTFEGVIYEKVQVSVNDWQLSNHGLSPLCRWDKSLWVKQKV